METPGERFEADRGKKGTGPCRDERETGPLWLALYQSPSGFLWKVLVFLLPGICFQSSCLRLLKQTHTRVRAHTYSRAKQFVYCFFPQGFSSADLGPQENTTRKTGKIEGEQVVNRQNKEVKSNLFKVLPFGFLEAFLLHSDSGTTDTERPCHW